jgi:hypothetical protein
LLNSPSQIATTISLKRRDKMKNLKSKIVFVIITLFLTLSSIGCNEEDSILIPNEAPTNDQAALEKIVNEDESLSSFDLNYNEEDAMSFVLGKTASEIFPVKIGQRMKLVEKNLNVVFDGDTAYGTLVKTFEGILFIVASSDSINGNVDSLDLDVYEKPFSTTITRNLIFVKVRNTDYPELNWTLSATSLPVGGTLTDNISIESVSIYLPDGEILTIESPLDYYLSRGPSLRRLLPVLAVFQPVGVEVNIKSSYAEKDFVTLTYGAMRDRTNHRAKRRFEFVEGSERFDGEYYYRTYKGEWIVNQSRGYKHAVINAFPWGVIKDSEAPVESNSWGIPYLVN